MNRAEYSNAIRDLLDLTVDVTPLLPADGSSQGFDNLAEALSVSPSHIQGYVSAAMKISRIACLKCFHNSRAVTSRSRARNSTIVGSWKTRIIASSMCLY